MLVCRIVTNALLAMVMLTGMTAHAGLAQTDLTLKSPDEKVVVNFGLKIIGDKSNCPVYSVSYRNLPVVVESSLGLDIKGTSSFEAGFEIARVTKSSRDTVWHPVYGERNKIRDHYNQIIVDLKETAEPNRRLRLTFRAYNEGMAFCYTLPRQLALKDFVISKEKTQFRFLADHTAWAVDSAQGVYSKVTLSKVKNNCERPTTIQIDDNIFAAVGEAALVDYARMRLSPAKDRPNTLVSSLASEVKAVAPFNTPWRFVLLGDTPGQLLERNYLILNLNEPCAINDTSWIKPGKVIREVTLTTVGGKSCVDFAAEHNLQYVEFDAGWYGPEGSGQSDARTISLDPGRSRGPLDLHHVIDYAKKTRYWNNRVCQSQGPRTPAR
jgi:alpha-glucosidase